MLQHLNKYEIILGSASPRRSELLKGLDINFRILPINVDENYPADLIGVQIPKYLAQKKAAFFTQ